MTKTNRILLALLAIVVIVAMVIGGITTQDNVAMEACAECEGAGGKKGKAGA